MVIPLAIGAAASAGTLGVIAYGATAPHSQLFGPTLVKGADECGGRSLLATRLVSQIRDALALDCSIRTVFDAPTVRELANYLQKAGHSQSPWLERARPDHLPL
jgi:hypothetical protein